jgi:ribosomal protein S8
MVKKFVCDLNNGINKGESYVIIDRNFLSLKILYILQRHNLISSFNTINENKVLVILDLYLFVIMLLIKYIRFNDEVLL